MRPAGLAVILAVLPQLGLAAARADVVCLPGGPVASPGTYPGSARRYQGSLPSLQERVGDRTTVPSTWQVLPGNPSCYVVPHASAANGAGCKRDGDCADRRCRPFPDGDRYCVSGRKACPVPRGEGAPGGAVIALHQQCYECASGLGWKLCGEAAKWALPGKGDDAAASGPADEPAGEDWRYREPAGGDTRP